MIHTIQNANMTPSAWLPTKIVKFNLTVGHGPSGTQIARATKKNANSRQQKQWGC